MFSLLVMNLHLTDYQTFKRDKISGCKRNDEFIAKRTRELLTEFKYQFDGKKRNQLSERKLCKNIMRIHIIYKNYHAKFQRITFGM